MFNVKWSHNKGEAKLKLSKQWDELAYLEKLDGLHDALHDITDLYNKTFNEWSTSNKVSVLRRIK